MDASCTSRVRFESQSCNNSHDSKEVNYLNRVSTSGHKLPIFLLASIFLLSTHLEAQVLGAASPMHVHGSVVTSDGAPVVDVTVEIRDLRGIPLGKGFTDRGGSFEISTAMGSGEYILLATKKTQVGDARITLDQPDLAVRIAFPVTSETIGARPSRETVSVAQLSIPAKAWRHLTAAHKEFSRGKLDAATNEIDAVLRLAPVCAQAFSMRALIKLAARNFPGAAEDARHAVFLDENDAESYIALGTAYNSLKEFSKAEEAVRQALSIRPDSWQGQIEMAKSLYGQGQYILALSELDSVGRDFPDVHLVRGDVLMCLNRSQEAAEQFSIFLRQAPGDPRTQQIEQIIASHR